eukprot:Rhum_TRINITY_DN7398_c0_g1::Rhum_TRINITY_DN7398_c0_g1_i1::g.22471::m.22471
MGHARPALRFVLLAAVQSAAAASNPYYISQPTYTCVNDGKHAYPGAGHILLYDTQDACCNGLTPRERRQCRTTDVPSVVYPDYATGRCSSNTRRPPVVYPTCVINGQGAAKAVAGKFLTASLVSDNELCCKQVYVGLHQAAVTRCSRRQGAWYWVDGMGCVQDNPLADDPVIYATARTVGSLSACPATYFYGHTAFMCSAFTCPTGWTGRGYSIHCGTAEGDCTKELCCKLSPITTAPDSLTCATHDCTNTVQDKEDKDSIICTGMPPRCDDDTCCDDVVKCGGFDCPVDFQDK